MNSLLPQSPTSTAAAAATQPRSGLLGVRRHETSRRSFIAVGDSFSWVGTAPFDHFPLDQNGLHLKDVPVWRDAPSDATDNANVPPPSPGPVWRDSGGLLGDLNTRDTRDFHCCDSPETQNLRRPAWPSSSTSRRSQSPLGTLLRRKRNKPRSSAAMAGDEKRHTKTPRASRRKNRTAGGEAVWNDSPAAPRVLVDPTRLLDLVLSAEAAPSKAIGNQAFSGSTAVVAGGVGATSPLPSPPNEKSPKINRDWRRITRHPLRASRKDNQGQQGRSSTTGEGVLRPKVHFADNQPGSTALSHSRDSDSGGFLSAVSALSAASFRRSTASIPGVTPAQARSPHTVSGGTLFSSQTIPAPPRAPAFEPRRGSEHHRTTPSRRSRQHRVQVSGGDVQFRHCRSGRRAKQAAAVSR